MGLVVRKPAFCICENKDAFVFAIRIVQTLYYLNPKFQVTSRLLWLYSPVCVGPGQKPRRPVSHNEAHIRSVFDDNLGILFIFSPKNIIFDISP